MTNGKTIWIIIGVVIVIMMNQYGAKRVDMETLLKQEWTTEWADNTDPPNFALAGDGRIRSDSVTADAGFSVYSEAIFNKIFKGQEVVFLVSGSGKRDTAGSTSGGCTVRPAGSIIGCEGAPGQSFTCSQSVIRFKAHTFDTSIYDVFQDDTPISTINVGDGFKVGLVCTGGGGRGGFRGSIDFIGSKAEFECDINTEDEVWLTERYSSRVNIDDLTYSPTKLCHEEHPATLRQAGEGEVKIYPNPYPDLNTGETIPDRELTADETLTIRYATTFVEGVIDPLPLNQEYVCTQRDENNKCSNWIIQQIVEPVQIIVPCGNDNNCPQPLKNECSGYFQGCQNNFCAYDDFISNSVVCKNEVATIINEIEKIQERGVIDVGPSIFQFAVNHPSGSFNFGIEPFGATIDFTCSIPEGTITFPYPNPDCYKATASFEGKNFDLKDEDIFYIRDNIKVTYYAGGHIKFVENEPITTKKDLTGKFIFEILGNPIDIEPEGGSNVLKDSIKIISSTVTNNLPKGNMLLKVNSIAKRTNQILPEIREEHTINEGINEIGFNMNTFNLGINEFMFQPFYKITVNNMEVLLPSDKINFNMNVVDELSGINPDIITLPDDEITEPIIDEESKPTSLVGIVGIIIGIIFILATLKKRK